MENLPVALRIDRRTHRAFFASNTCSHHSYIGNFQIAPRLARAQQHHHQNHLPVKLSDAECNITCWLRTSTASEHMWNAQWANIKWSMRITSRIFIFHAVWRL